jgi:hypothetical protein
MAKYVIIIKHNGLLPLAWHPMIFPPLSDAPGNVIYTTSYIGTDSGHNVSTGANSLSGAINSDTLVASPDDSNVTWMGVLMLCFLVLSIIGVITFIVH